MARNTVALTATGPGGAKDLRSLKTDSSGALIVAGSVGGGSEAIQISDGSQSVTITDVAGKKSLDVNVADITLDHSNDSIRLGDGSNLIGSTLDAGVRGLNTHITNEALSTQPVAFKSLIDEVSSTLSYIGKALPGSGTASAVW